MFKFYRSGLFIEMACVLITGGIFIWYPSPFNLGTFTVSVLCLVYVYWLLLTDEE